MRVSQCYTYKQSGKWHVIHGHPEDGHPVKDGDGKCCLKIGGIHLQGAGFKKGG